MSINEYSTAFPDRFMPIATDIGGVVGIVVLLALFGTVFTIRREYRRLAILFVGVGGAVLLNLILKAVFMRERPDLWVQLIHETGYSFPSGHAMSSAGLGLSLVVALWSSRWRWWAAYFRGLLSSHHPLRTAPYPALLLWLAHGCYNDQ